MKSFKCAQRLSISMLIVFAVLSAFSCKGMLLPPPTTSKTGKLTIALPGNGARRGYTQDDVDFYKISIISESTKEIVIPAQETNAETFSTDLKAGSYSVIVQGMNNSNVSQPLFYGRTNKVTVTAGETTAATILMRELGFDSSLYSGHMEMVNPDWESGKLPSLAFDYFDFEGWYSDAECTQAITEYPATDSEDFTYPFAKLVRKPVFYATQNGDGDKKGLNAENPMELLDAFIELASFSRETGKVPTLVLLGDVYLDGSSVAWSVNIIGAKNGVDNDPVTVTGLEDDFVVPFDAGISCTVKNLIIKNGSAATGIKNKGNLTFENCVFNPDSKDLAIENKGSLTLTNCQINSTSGAQGIKNTGSLKMTDCSISGCGTDTTLGGGIYTTQPITLINTSITGCNGSYGNMIYCAKEEGSNPTVNGIGAGFEGDFYFDGEIPGSTQYDASTFPASATAAGVFYASTSGTGDGKSASSPMNFTDAVTQAASFTRCTPTIYLTESLTFSSTTTISSNLNIIGAGSSEDGKVTLTKSTGNPFLTFTDSCECTLKNIKLDGNNTSQGIWVQSNASLSVENCDITKCHYSSYGGGIRVDNGHLTIRDSSISGCTADEGGSGIYSINSSLEISNVTIENCTGKMGAGLYLSGEAEISNCAVLNCKKESGGALNSVCIQGNSTVNGLSFDSYKNYISEIQLTDDWTTLLSQ